MRSTPLTLGPERFCLPRSGVEFLTDAWHELVLSWDFRSKSCRVEIDGRAGHALPQLRAISEGANYLRLRVLSDEPRQGGLMVESVAAKVDLNVPPEIDVPR